MGNLLKSLFGTKKDKKMVTNEQSTQDLHHKYSNLDFQWIKGENLSAVENYKDISTNGDFTFIDFMSGRKINIDLLDEYMVSFPAIPPEQPKNLPAPKQETPVSKPDSSVTDIVYEDSKSPQNDSPIYKLLKKQKKNMVEVSIKIKLNLPPKELYSVLLSSFEDAEKEITEFVLDGVDIENIKNSLAESVKKSYYTDSPKPSSDKTTTKKINKIETP